MVQSRIADELALLARRLHPGLHPFRLPNIDVRIHVAMEHQDRRYHAIVQGYYDDIARRLGLGERRRITGVLAQ